MFGPVSFGVGLICFYVGVLGEAADFVGLVDLLLQHLSFLQVLLVLLLQLLEVLVVETWRIRNSRC